MVSEELYQEKLEENKALAMKVAALFFELENIKRALFGSKSDCQLGAGLSWTQPSLLPSELVTDAEPADTEQISYERNKPRASKVKPDRLRKQ